MNHNPSNTLSPEEQAAVMTEVESLLTLLDQELHVSRSTHPVSDHETFRQLAEQAQALHAPWLHLGHGPLRWLARLLNLPVWPWARKQAHFNGLLFHALQLLHQQFRETEVATISVTRLEARIARLENRMRKHLPQDPFDESA